MPKIKPIDNDHKIFSGRQIEAILCLAVLIASDILPHNATMEDAGEYWDKTGCLCANCPLHLKCLACIINE